MEIAEAFKVLRKKATPEKKQRFGVTYTRVSTKEQADNNLSLETQLELCTEQAKEKNIIIIEDFGKTYESAKSDKDRKEFQRMLKFVQSRTNSSQPISYIIVYSLDRFSRTGPGGMNIVEGLAATGVQLIAVKDDIDYSLPQGRIFAGMKMLFSRYENEERALKCMDGTRTMLKKGGWPSAPPIGYTKTVEIDGLMKSTINNQGELIKAAFRMKLYEQKTNTEIQQYLLALGLNLHRQKLTAIFKNPFYCGIVSHRTLNYEPVAGIQEAMITQEEFLELNNINKAFLKSSQVKEDESFPLKASVNCIKCNKPLTGYHVKKKNAKYYKCNTKACNVNINSAILNNSFSDLLKDFKMPVGLTGVLRNHLTRTFNNLNIEQREKANMLVKSLEEKKKDLMAVKRRYAIGELEKDIYTEVHTAISSEIYTLDIEFLKAKAPLSNVDKYVEYSLFLSQNLSSLWEKSSFGRKQSLQKLVFPNGVLYDKVNHNYRTSSVNNFFQISSLLTGSNGIKKEGQTNESIDLSYLVAPAGIEPTSRV